MPSKKHIELQHMAGRWIRNRSFKMCGLPESEVIGYVADFVAVVGMLDKYHTRYAEHSGLTKKYVNYGLNNLYSEHGDIDRWYVCVFEIKVSRNDFLNTFGNKESPHAKARMKPVGTAHWVVTPKDLIKPEELPDFWGLLVPYGSGLAELKKPKLNILPNSKLHSIAFDMLWLQMNYRKSYYEQIAAMAETIKVVHRAIIKQRPAEELIYLSTCAIKACRGFIAED